MKIPLEIAIIAANVLLCFTLTVRQIHKSFPHFYRYTFFQAFAAAFSLLAYIAMKSAAYSVTYYVLIFFGDILSICVAAEIAGKLLGPQGCLPRWVTDRLILVISVGVAAALTTAIFLLNWSYGKELGRAAITVEHWMAGITWVSFSAILVFWRTLKVFRRQTIAASICSGFVLYFTVSVFTVFIRGHRAFVGLAESAGVAGMVAYLAILLWWVVVAMLPGPVFTKATHEQKIFVLQEFEVIAQKAAARAVIVSSAGQ